MDVAVKARRSQALIDSIEELIALERDVSRATECCNTTAVQAPQPQQVMVPVTEVAFMPGTVAGDSVMVGLGEDYYVERTPRKAQAILRRRMEDLSGQARVLAKDALLVPQPPLPSPRKPRRPAQGESDATMKWTKGFLSAGPDRPSRGQTSPQGTKAPANAQKEPPGDRSSSTPTEIKYNDSEGHERVVGVEDGEDAPPIMEIREWLDESGKQTSVDVTDLGKVLRTTPKAVKGEPQPTAEGAGKSRPNSAIAAPPTEPNAGNGRSSSDLDSIFARLEEQEKKAEKQAASPSLGPQWNKGFLDGGAKRPARPPSAATTPRVEEARRQTTGAGSAVLTSDGTATSKAHAFRETVVEKTNTSVASSVSNDKAAVAPARISRFKARRQGL